MEEDQLSLFDFTLPGLVCGADEAGRGPLAGPVAIAAVILPDDFDISLLNDSKKLTEKRRFELEPIIKEKAIAWSLVLTGPEEIDRSNILACSLDGMAKCYEELAKDHEISVYYVDGNKSPHIENANVVPVVKGDSKIPQIMAASILAKCARDRYMIERAKDYPQYGFEVHKGYGTKAHYEAIFKYGITPLHRKTFLKNLEDHRPKAEQE